MTASHRQTSRLLRPTRWVRHLVDHLAVAREGSDPEGVHQVRVAGRRLRVFLLLGGHRALDDDLRWLVRALGRARDLDVLCATALGDAEVGPAAPPPETVGPPAVPTPAPPPEALAFARWLRAQQRAARAEAEQVLSSFRVDGVVHALEVLPPVRGQVARTALATLTADVGRLSARWLATRDAAAGLDALHRLRRALRRVRYGREWLGETDRVLPALQDVFGAVCDVAAMLRLLDAFAAETKLVTPQSRQALVRALDTMMERARVEWAASGAAARW